MLQFRFLTYLFKKNNLKNQHFLRKRITQNSRKYQNQKSPIIGTSKFFYTYLTVKVALHNIYKKNKFYIPSTYLAYIHFEFQNFVINRQLGRVFHILVQFGRI